MFTLPIVTVCSGRLVPSPRCCLICFGGFKVERVPLSEQATVWRGRDFRLSWAVSYVYLLFVGVSLAAAAQDKNLVAKLVNRGY